MVLGESVQLHSWLYNILVLITEYSFKINLRNSGNIDSNCVEFTSGWCEISLQICVFKYDFQKFLNNEAFKSTSQPI